MIINSCKSSFQSLGSVPGRSCVAQEHESVSEEKNCFSHLSLDIFKLSSTCLGYNCGNRMPCNKISI